MRRLSILITACLLLSTGAGAVAPSVMSYQGRLTDATGTPVPDGSYSVTFSIHNASTGGDLLWSEVQTVVTADGLFAILLGASNPIPDSALSDSAAYLEMTISPDPPISPRTRLAGAPYAFASRSVSGGGPVEIEGTNVTSGESGTVSLNVDSETDPFGRVKVQFPWDLHDPAGSDSLHWEQSMSTDSGITEITTATSPTAQATGKRQHKPIVVTKSLDMTDALDSLNWEFSLNIDSGFTTGMQVRNSQATVETKETGHAHGHLDYLKKVGDPATSDSVFVDELLSVDSGFTEITTAASPTAQSTGKRQHKPVVITKELGASNSSSSAALTEVLHADSGIQQTAGMTKAELISEISHGTSQTREHVLLSRQVGVPGSATSSSLELENGNDGPLLSMNRQGTAADPDDDGVVILDASVPGGVSLLLQSSKSTLGTGGVEAKADNNRSTVRPHDLSPSGDSSFIDIAVDDTTGTIVFAKTSGTIKYEPIILKRGASRSSMALSHIGAGASDGVFISSDAAAGGQLGINTSSPALAFELAGSGCYTGSFGLCSDRRFKENVTGLNHPLETLKRLRGISFTWKREKYPDRRFPEGDQIGVIAQELEKVLPSLVTTDAEGYKSVDYARLAPVIIESVKAQQDQIDKQQQQIQKQQQQIEELQALVAQLVQNGEGRSEASYTAR
jgi:hypothetical protein